MYILYVYFSLKNKKTNYSTGNILKRTNEKEHIITVQAKNKNKNETKRTVLERL